MTQHLHLLVNGHADRIWTPGPQGDLLDVALAEQAAAEWLNGLVQKIGMKAVFPARAAYVSAPGNEGITASINIETSHIAFHIWDSEFPDFPAKVQLDLYTCGDLDPEHVLGLLDENFAFTSGTWLLLDREDGFVVKASGQFPL